MRLDTSLLIGLLGRRRLAPREKPWAEAWLLSLGWRREHETDWIRPSSLVDYSLRGACRVAAEVELAQMLRARGWLARPLGYEDYQPCSGAVCRAPGAVNGQTRSIIGSRGRWVTLAQAARRGLGGVR